MKHTPGPWRWLEDRFWGGYSGIVGKDDQSVLFADHANDGDDGAAWFEEFPSEADRHLIAAAPEMLDALIQARGALLLDHMVDDEGKPFGTTQEALSAIDAAIAKVEGKED